MDNLDIRWKQRFSSYKRALAQLTKFIEKGDLNELEEQGLIQAFEYTHELAWKLLKEFLSYQGTQDIYGSRDATRMAFGLGLIEDGESWMNMIKDRNRTSDTYNRDVAKEIAANITKHFFDLFTALQTKMQAIEDEQ
ncbi:nucleotidyltransferase substrate binding protein [Leptolyngbya sp. BC1307]|uniref:nucleotidyltransferase substrate binding protein n=1 Tax=Leptolyngbya sp. BC1307 TaxID=2029589 RepID=UPI000EFCA37B|nr:nucleotidyltransferase substrate binding protein [Leptolyngbya sp. BC1307]